ncbi:OmpA family protein [Actinomadura kijaniata]|uniref:OmpA family protein n=1 Tax=Actinomadura kijaniata TaxID=46161 RepID=UPI003F1DFF6F
MPIAPRALALPLAVLLVASCDDTGPKKVDPPVTGASAAAPAHAPAGGSLSREGWFGSGDPLHARVEVRGVERAAGRTTARLVVTSLDASAKQAAFPVTLLDPVNRRLYRPTAAPGARSFAPNAPQEVTVDFPALSGGPERLTVLTPGSAGEITGVPVTGTDAPPAAPAAVDLYSITEGETRDVTASAAEVRLSLRADALFASGKATLGARAGRVLDEAVKGIKAEADPARPLTVNGHTDGKGADDDNLKLSRERAEAVEKELRSRLGGDFKYTTSGRGEQDPVAKEGGADDARARSRNARVEISYAVRRTETTASASPTTSTSPASPTPRTGTATPAAFRAQDGAKVASRHARFGQQRRRIDVKPFYRDGAYIVAVFDLVNEGPGPTPPDASYAHRDYPGGLFTSFGIVDGKDVHRAVRIGTETAYLGALSAAFRTAPGEPGRGFVYLPAPPGDPRTVVFDAGPFGKVNNVPVS